MRKQQFAILSSYISGLLALPCHAQDAEVLDSTLNFRYSKYAEDAMANQDVSVGSLSRYDIEISQLNVFIPLDDTFDLTVNHLTESMSGASPWYTEVGPNSETLVAMSGATIFEKRNDTQLVINQKQPGMENRFLFGYSSENDYQAQYIQFGQAFDWKSKNNRIEYSLHYSDDQLTPTQNELVTRITSAEKESRGFSIAFSQVIDTTSLWDVGIFYTQNSGFLTDPYKQFDIATPLDLRPSKRNQQGIELGWSKHWPNKQTSTHLRYRYYDDDWGVQSHSIQFDGAIELARTLSMNLGLRVYGQSEADFYQAISLPITTGYGSSDYRLSSYGSISYQAQINYQIDPAYGLIFSLENYRSISSLGLSSSQSAHPGLVNYSLLGIEIEYRF